MSHDAGSTPVSPMRLRPVIAIGLAIAIVAVAGGLTFRAHEYHELTHWTDAQQVPTVQLAPMATIDGNDHHLSLPGHVEAWISAPIHARVGGYLRTWTRDIGSTVHAGDVLGTIDTPEIDQQLHQATAGLARAQADLRLASLTSKRWQNLLASNSVSKQEADEKLGEAEVAKANVASAQADVDRLQALESFKQITAPFDGTITARNTDIGDLISATNANEEPLFTVSDTRRMRLYVSIPQGYASTIHPGMHVKVNVMEHPDKAFDAVLIGSSGAIAKASGTLLAQFELANPNGELLPGDYAQVSLPVDSNAHVVNVPATALIFRAAGPQLAVLGANNTIQLRDVHIGMDMGDILQIDRGVTSMDRIVDHPPDSIMAGDKVTVATAAAPKGKG
ncbi:efflux RND transporter periplasmic adaptor subunit [Pinirhizobacter soli]|uniref:efflux RND transporter periplasmic adaptor subunit n=1 Tax=Pinirhizobacter soli TaxID=2786953 RepID=UPI00202A889F|nr:efflux RND transporter periplasmic adaptor subunit [Pinirhizobacter soli]